jgi:uncharacterized repeat protein (TIGR03843 family)
MAIDVNSPSVLAVLESLELHVTGRLVDASNATLLCSLGTDSPEAIRVIYKPIAGERPLWDFPDGKLAWRERAAYLMSSLAGFHIVPPTILRDGPFGDGAVQLWIDGDESLDVVEYAQGQSAELRTMVLFDAVVNNTDRKFGHILKAETGELYGCDHGVSFHEEPKLRTVLWQFAGEDFTDSEIALLRKADDALSHDEFEHLLTGAEISATRQRVSELLETASFPYPTGDWPAVPWPPY